MQSQPTPARAPRDPEALARDLHRFTRDLDALDLSVREHHARYGIPPALERDLDEVDEVAS